MSKGQAGLYDIIEKAVTGSKDRDREYWRDVGTLDAYYEANLDLIAVEPVFNLYNNAWPLHTGYTGQGRPNSVHADADRTGHAVDSIISPGVVVSGGEVSNSILSPGTRVNSWSSVQDSVLMDGVNVHRHAQVQKAILDKNVDIEEGATIGVDAKLDASRGLTVTDGGITVVPKNARITRR